MCPDRRIVALTAPIDCRRGGLQPRSWLRRLQPTADDSRRTSARQIPVQQKHGHLRQKKVWTRLAARLAANHNRTGATADRRDAARSAQSAGRRAQRRRISANAVAWVEQEVADWISTYAACHLCHGDGDVEIFGRADGRTCNHRPQVTGRKRGGLRYIANRATRTDDEGLAAMSNPNIPSNAVSVTKIG